MFKESALANLVVSFAPVAVGLVMAFFLSGAMKNAGGYARISLVCYGIGFVLFAAAKIHNIQRGHPVSFGSALMPPLGKWAYRIGYVLMVFGSLLTLVVLVALKFTE